MDAPVEYLTPDEVVARLRGKIKPKTLANWRSSKNSSGPPFTKVGGRVLYPKAPFERWERSRTGSNTSDYGTKTG